MNVKNDNGEKKEKGMSIDKRCDSGEERTVDPGSGGNLFLPHHSIPLDCWLLLPFHSHATSITFQSK